jgi:aminobenzoyl-glutamate transport protein
MSEKAAKNGNKKGIFVRFLDGVEKLGNKMCDPVTLFLIIIAIILVSSAIFGLMGVSAINPATNQEVKVVNLLNAEGLVKMLTSFTGNLANFPIYTLVIVIMLGVGLAENTGMIEALLKRSVLKAPEKIVVPLLFFIGINSNVAGDAGFILMPLLGAMIFGALGKHPIAGMCAGYAAVAGGFSANIAIGTTDAIIAGFTEPAARMILPDYVANPAMNWYFIATSSILLIPVGVWINKRFVEKRLGEYSGPEIIIEEITDEQKKGLRWAGIAFIAVIILILVGTVPGNGILREPGTGSLSSMKAPFMNSIVPLITLIFLIPALAYGFGAGIFKNDKDVASYLGKAMSGMGSFILFCVVASQMIAYFSWSNLGPVIAIKGANFLKSIGVTGFPLIVLFILLSTCINFLISSNSAKWAILAPVFIPMFALLGYDPAFTQMAYRIGDSITNPITPMMAYFGILVTTAKKYDKDAGMGSLMSCLLPYSIWFFIFWTLLLGVWYIFGIAPGPGYSIFIK